MVLLAKWLLENDPEARILIVTDRDELDKQIEDVMKDAGVIGENSPSPRFKNRPEFVAKLGATLPQLLCVLLHKFDPADLTGPPPPVHGRFYVFVDECHRTQGGDMNRQMKRWLENAIFIGFTGTPLLKKEAAKLRTQDIFGTYIHTYKFHEGVADGREHLRRLPLLPHFPKQAVRSILRYHHLFRASARSDCSGAAE